MCVHHAPESPAERRTFLGILSGLIAAGISAVLGVNIGRFALGPAFTKADAEDWSDVGALTGIPEGQLTKRNLLVARVAGWGNFTAERAVWVVRNGAEVKVFTAVCPHLGCTVNANAEGFLCACHNSQWNTSGQTLAGPAPRGLDTLEHRVEGGKLQVRYADFKQGIPNKEAIG
ncbi:MAG: ubiquinol-cytochrome c reductase iron-sulfur subunit [Acidobacteria bacterium]|nr:ubiquinol-cytochrome c reductase iron-sulfur subunit [Acidobacteriota bacterium]MBI3423633.1 ubiquinol-cytochrome c reductase iron-sulfur subunit [Acidobacteriota bacterium]